MRPQLPVFGLMIGLMWAATGLGANGDESQTFGPDPQQYRDTVDRAIKYLALSQAQDGSVSSQIGIGPTALATLGLLRSGRGIEDPQVAKGARVLTGVRAGERRYSCTGHSHFHLRNVCGLDLPARGESTWRIRQGR